MASKVYGGYCYFPEHPLADMHGIVRFCVQVESTLRVRDAVQRYGVYLFSIHSHYWGESLSHVEAEVTAKQYGEVFFCSPTKAYLSVESYHHDRKLMEKFRQESQRLAHAEGSKVASAPRRGKRTEFP